MHLPVSYALNLAPAGELEVEPEQVQGVLAAVAPIVGTARVVSALGNIVEGLEIDLEIAELEARVRGASLDPGSEAPSTLTSRGNSVSRQ